MSTGRQLPLLSGVFKRLAPRRSEEGVRGLLRSSTLKLTAAGLILALVLSDSISPVPPYFTMPRLEPVSAADVETPGQGDGSAAGLSHEADSAVVADVSEGQGPDVDAPDGALPHNWPDLPEDADSLRPPMPEGEEEAVQLAEVEPEPEITGFDPDISEELVEERDEFSRTYENEDGSLSTDFSLEPIHFQEEDGSWEQIDTSLVEENTETWTNAADSRKVEFAARADGDELARMELDGDHSLSFSLEGAEGTEGHVLEDENNTIVYEEALPGVDVELKSLVGGVVKETIWLNEAPSSPEEAVWRFPLQLQGLEPVLLEDGSVDLVDAEGESMGHIPAGYMEDSDIDPHSGDGEWSEAVEFSLLQEEGGWVLEVTADFDWLTDDERVYPVGVDPTTAWNYNASHDTYVQTGYNTSRYSEQELKVGTYNGGSTKTASYLKFNSLVSELRHHEIYEAELYLFNHWSYSCTPKPVYVHEVTQSWDHKSISSYPGPSYSSTALGSASFARGWMPAGASSSSCPGRYEAINLGTRGRDLVQAWVDGDKPNHGITVRASTTDSSAWKKFGSRESWGAPYMTVTYSPYRAEYDFVEGENFNPPPQANQSTNIKIKVTNRGRETWTPTNGYRLSYQVFDQDGKRVYHIAPNTPMPRNVATGQTATVTAKIGPLPPGTWTIKFDMTHKSQSFAAWGVPMSLSAVLTVPDLPPQILDYSPRDGATVATLTPEFTALGRNNDAWPTDGMEFWFNFCDGEWPDWECVDSGWQSGTSWKLPEGRMQWGNQYWWNVFVRDGSQLTESGWLRVIANADQPAVTSNLSGSGSTEGTVNALIGNYTETVTDAAVPAVGPPLSITRTYNSSDPRQGGIFGSGWSTRFDMDVRTDVDGTGNAVVTYPDGRQYRFARNADGSYSPPMGMHAVLARTDDGWRLMDKASTSYVFDGSGRLLEVSDHQGRSQSIDYNSEGRISTVTADGGRHLEFAWAQGRVATVTAHGEDTSAQWTYAYDGQRLTQVCNPEQECTDYSYVDGSHYRAAVMDANPYGYWRFEEGEGTSSANEKPQAVGGEPATITGSALGAQGVLAGVDTHALTTGQGAYAQLPEAILHRVGTRITVEAWFSTTGHGTVIGAVDKPTASTQRNQIIYVGTDGKLRAQFWTTDNTVDPITTTSAVNDGQWHHVALTSDGMTQTLYLDGEKVGTKSGQVEHRNTKFVYVGHGIAGSGWPSTRSTTGDFPFTGTIDEVAIYQRPLHADTITLHHTSGLDTADRLRQTTTPEGNQATLLSFDETTSRVSSHTDRNAGTWAYSDLRYNGDVKDEDAEVTGEITITDPRGATSTTRYDALNGYRRVADIDQLGYQTSYTYDIGGFTAGTTLPSGAQLRFWNDARGNRLGRMSCRDVEATNCQWEWYSYSYNADDVFDPRNDQLVAFHDARSTDFLDTTYRTWWAYDEHGNQTSESTPASEGFPDGRTTRYLYTDGTEAATGGGTVPAGLVAESWDADGHITRYSYNAHGDTTRVRQPSGLVTEYTYDGLGQMLTSTVITSDHPDGVTTTFTYDDSGRVLTETGPRVVNEITDATHQQRATHLYDNDGNRIRTTISDLTGDDPDRVTMWAYNQYGQMVSQTDSEGRTEYYGYDTTGAQTHHQDAAGTMFRTVYTDRGQVAERLIERWVGHPDEDNDPAPLVLESNAYDPDGNLASTTDAVGRTTSYTYYADGLLAQVIATGAMLNNADAPQDVVLESHTYDAAGNPIRTITGDGKVRMDQTWSADSLLTSQTLDPEGLDRTTTYTYDGRGNAIETVSTDGDATERTRSTYDAGGFLIEEAVVVGDEELLTSYDVNELGLTTAVTDPRAHQDGARAADFTSLMRYDTLGRLIEERLPAVDIERYGEPTVTERPTIRYGYDLVGNLTHQQDAEGHTSIFGYDLVGQQISSQAPDFTGVGGVTLTPTAHTTYDELGRITDHTDALGNTRSYTWDQLGNLARMTDPELEGHSAPGEWTFLYNPVGELLAVTNPVGARTEATYDDLGRQVTDTQIERVPMAAAYTTRYTYDVSGNPLTVTDPLDNTTTNTYNPAGELVQTTNPVGETTSFTYDLAGRPTTVTDPAGTQVLTTYDQAGRATATRVLDTEGTELRTQSTAYDAAGLAIAHTDALGNVTKTDYNALGQPIRRVEPVGDNDTITTTFGYDANGQRTRITDGRGNSTYTIYNPNGQVEKLIEPATSTHTDASDRTWTTFYDAAGNPVRQHVPGGIVRERTYNAFGNLMLETATGAEAETDDRGFHYDLLGRPSGFSTPEGGIEIVYDDRGNQVQFLGPNTVSFNGIAPGTTLSYDAAGRLESRLDMTGTTTFSYDAAGRVIGHHDAVTGTDLTIDYTPTGLPSSITTDDGAIRTYTHDPLGQLVEDTLETAGGTQALSTAYTYDTAGRITERTNSGTGSAGSHRYGYDQASRLTSWTAPDGTVTEYGWDDSGNRVQAGTETFTYNERNQLTSSSEGDAWSYNPDGTVSSQFVDGQLRTPAFDGFERMVDPGNGSGTYAYDALGRIAERTTTGGDTHTFVYSDLSNNQTGILDGTDTPISEYGRDPYGQLVSIADQGQAPALAYSNAHTDLVATYTSTGALTSSADYGPFGEAIGNGAVASLGYQGEWTDPSTGDVNMHARWYQPGTGRFVSRDTMTLEPSPSVQANRYTYANANPVLYIDPSGHSVCLTKKLCVSMPSQEYVERGIQKLEDYANRGVQKAGDAVKTGLRIRRILNPIDVFLGVLFHADPLADATCNGPCALNFKARLGFTPQKPQIGSGTAGPASWGGGKGGWTVTRVSVPGGGSRIVYVPIIVDNRKDILLGILNTPQERPPIKNQWTQDKLDEYRKKREKDIGKEKIFNFDLADYSDYDQALQGLDGVSDFDITGDNGECRSFINLSEINKKGQRGTAVARLCGWMDVNAKNKVDSQGNSYSDKNEKRYNPGSNPPGYVTRQDNRAHLIASLFYGPGWRQNIVATYAVTNTSAMAGVETRVRRRLEAGNEVIYAVTPIYEGDEGRPWAIRMTAIDDGGVTYDYCILNNGKYWDDGGRAASASVCDGPKPGYIPTP
ncbi:DNRLRE domain-containing protein [Nocardiopsis algeriensis]|uniref:RHS repeat-associated protein n=1 Tax=Nocardiopsis algeriensis TaxID=1478215 RepID=A0A841ITJ9_9ACTN|nr:DNRLRE domain-containing protein [Nocardiopsis algeriensis]MBB6122239.1 RHS repeat-associated protein [Nocardiopsis algeriensis]